MKVLVDKKETSIGFVILHYNAIKETRDCIDSIIHKMDTTNYKIVVVDNGSPNNTGKVLYEEFKDHTQVEVILTKENLGFARGNNVGFMHLKEENKWDFICMLNNDTCIIQEDFLKVICDEYNASHFGVLGPLIILNDNKYNPIDFIGPIYEEIKKDIKRIKSARVLNKLYLRGILLSIIKLLKRRKETNNVRNSEVFKRHENVKLHGCCYIFSPKFIDIFDGLDNRTFMFREEEFLYLHVKDKGLPMVYNPLLKIRHFEDAATNSQYRNSRSKNEFLYKYNLESSKLLLLYMEELQRKLEK